MPHFRYSRRQFVCLLGTGLLYAAMGGCGTSAETPLRVAAHNWPGYEFMFLAKHEGELDPQMIELRETASASYSLQALLQGDVDAAALTLDEVLQARASGMRLTVVLVFDVSAGADVVLGRPPITELGDISGKRIGFEQGALGALLLAQALKAATLNRDQVSPVALTVDQQELAWHRGEIDVVVSYPPVSWRLMEQGAVKLFDSRQLPDTIVDVLAVRSDAMTQKREALQQLVAAHLARVDYLQRNPQDTSYRIAAHLDIPPQAVMSSYRGMFLPNLAYNNRLLGGDKPLLRDGGRMVQDIMVSEKILEKPDDLTGLLTDEFLPREMP